jgi:ABC-2 type transport system ATP-binding protein
MTDPTPAPVNAAPDPTALLSVRGISKRFGHVHAVVEVSLDLHPGEIMGFVGPNGAGKTTTMRIIAGLLKADTGAGQVLGSDISADRRAIARQVGYMPQRLALYGDLSVEHNLRFRADVYGMKDARSVVDASIEAFGLEAFRKQRAGKLSGGWARKLQLAASLIHRPRLILLDEPTAGLDAESRHEVWMRIARLSGTGAAVIINTHDLTEAEQCSRVALFADGRVVAQGTPDELSDAMPMEAVLVSGPDAHGLAGKVTALAGVMAAYPEGRKLRVLTAPGALAAVNSLVMSAGLSSETAPTRFEDTAFVAAQRSPVASAEARP